MSDGRCYIHGVDEDDTGAFHWCFECQHVWPTADDLRADCDRLAARLNKGEEPGQWWTTPDDLAEVYTCPLCAHDFLFAVGSRAEVPPTTGEKPE